MPSGKVTKILGKTEKSENLIVYNNINANDHDVTFSINNGIVRMRGTWSGAASGYIPAIMKLIKLNAGTYTLSGFNPTGLDSSQSVRLRIAKEDFSTIQEVILDGANKSFSFTLSETQDVRVLIRMGTFSSTNDFILAPMLVQGSVAPTEWKQGYEGLKHTHITGLKTTQINLWDEKWEVGGINTNGTLNNNSQIRSKNFIPVVPNQTYYGIVGSGDTFAVHYYRKDQSPIDLGFITINGSGTFTIPSDVYYIKFNVATAYGTTYNDDVCINKSDSTINGNYYPSKQDTLDIEFEGNGFGTAFDELNVEEGKNYQRMAEMDFSSLTKNDFIYEAYGLEPHPNGTLIYIARTKINPLPKDTSGFGSVANMINDKFATKSRSHLFDSDDAVAIQPNSVVMFYRAGNFTKQEMFAYVISSVMAYELATPIVTDVEVQDDGWIDNLIQNGSITQQVDTTDTTALIAKEVDVAVNVVVDNQ